MFNVSFPSRHKVNSRTYAVVFFSCSSRHEQAFLSGCPAGVAVPPASAAGHHSEEEERALLGRSGTAHLAAVPQDGREGILWYVRKTKIPPISFLSKIIVSPFLRQARMSPPSLCPSPHFWWVMSSILWCCLLSCCPIGRSFSWNLLDLREMWDTSSSAQKTKLSSAERRRSLKI